MRKSLLKIAMLLTLTLAAAGLCSCVHEFPGEEVIPNDRYHKYVNFTLHLTYDDTLPTYRELRMAVSERDNAEYSSSMEGVVHDVRYIIKGYFSESGNDFTRTADTTIYIVDRATDVLDLDVPMRLKNGNWRFIVWTDYVDGDSSLDKYYNTSDFANISVISRSEYPGNNEHRDAFRGEQFATLETDVEDARVEVEMHRPMAKIQLVAADFSAFVSTIEKMSVPGGSGGKYSVNDFEVMVAYTGYLPTVFNAYNDRPTDVWTGVSFMGNIVKLSDNEAQVATDYIFVNSDETKVTLTVSVYNKEGLRILTSDNLEIPILRGHLTVVTGSFLTTEGNGGVGIDPGFSDDYNIEIK